MSSNHSGMSDFSDTDTMNYVVRIVTPMRREFGLSLNVADFLHNRDYAYRVLQQAKTSQNENLRGYAHLLDARMFGPRTSIQTTRVSATPSTEPDTGVRPTSAPAASTDISLTEDQLRVQMMKKYKSGLR